MFHVLLHLIASCQACCEGGVLAIRKDTEAAVTGGPSVPYHTEREVLVVILFYEIRSFSCPFWLRGKIVSFFLMCVCGWSLSSGVLSEGGYGSDAKGVYI